MSEGFLVITGATGRVARRAVRALVAAGRPVRAIGRDPKRLRSLVADLPPRPEDAAEDRFETVEASLEDAEALKRAFDGASAVFSMIPWGVDDYRAFQDRVSRATAEAIEAASVPRVVTLSGVGAHLPEGTGPIVGLHRHERRLNEIPGLTALHLRPAFFMENHLQAVSSIRAQGAYGTPIRGDLTMPQIATRDVGDVVAEALGALEFTGRVSRELHGPRDFTMEDCTRHLGSAIDRPQLTYVQVPYAAAREAMVADGMPEDTADLMLEMYRAINDGRVAPSQQRTARNTSPTSFESWAATTFAPAFSA